MKIYDQFGLFCIKGTFLLKPFVITSKNLIDKMQTGYLVFKKKNK